jgi:hypothetical protein
MDLQAASEVRFGHTKVGLYLAFIYSRLFNYDLKIGYKCQHSNSKNCMKLNFFNRKIK